MKCIVENFVQGVLWWGLPLIESLRGKKHCCHLPLLIYYILVHSKSFPYIYCIESEKFLSFFNLNFMTYIMIMADKVEIF